MTFTFTACRRRFVGKSGGILLSYLKQYMNLIFTVCFLNMNFGELFI